MPASSFESMVCVRLFTVVVDLYNIEEESIGDNDDLNDANAHNLLHLNRVIESTLDPCVGHVRLGDILDFKVVIDVPCVHIHRHKLSKLTKHNIRHSSHAQLQQTLAVLIQGSEIEQSSQQKNFYIQVLN